MRHRAYRCRNATRFRCQSSMRSIRRRRTWQSFACRMCVGFFVLAREFAYAHTKRANYDQYSRVHPRSRACVSMVCRRISSAAAIHTHNCAHRRRRARMVYYFSSQVRERARPNAVFRLLFFAPNQQRCCRWWPMQCICCPRWRRRR